MRVINQPIQNTSVFGEFSSFNAQPYSDSHNSFIRQQIHEKKIDEFFLTDADAPHKRKSTLAMIGSFAGVIIPTLFFSKQQHGGLKTDSFKSILKLVDIHYGLKEILSVGLGGMIGGLIGGLSDRKEHHKLEKIEEATFQLMNISFPAILADTAIKMCEKTKRFNNSAAKISCILASILIGTSSAVAISNKIDDILFDRYNKNDGADRKLRKKDLIVHVDDLLGTLVLAKFPYMDKLHVNKILPLIYTWAGYNVGDV